MTSNVYVHPLKLAGSGKERGVAFLRLVGFLSIAVGLAIAAMLFATHVLGRKLGVGAGLTVQVLLISRALQALLMVVIPTIALLRLSREPAAFCGWGSFGRLRHLGLGALAGAGLMTGLLLVLAVLGAFSFGTVS